MKEYFISKLPDFCLCGDSYSKGIYSKSKSDAIRFKHITFIKEKGDRVRKAIIADIDKSNSKEIAFSRMINPTFYIANPTNGHGHVLFILTCPIDTSDPLANKIYQFVRKTISLVFEGDPGYTGIVFKNPLHPDWKTIFTRVEYNIHDLVRICKRFSNTAAAVETSNFSNFKAQTPIVNQIIIKQMGVEEGERYVYLFNLARLFAYRMVNKLLDKVEFTSAIKEYLIELNSVCKPPLPDWDIDKLCNSICDWTLRNRYFLSRHETRVQNEVVRIQGEQRRQERINEKKRSVAIENAKRRRERTEQKIVEGIHIIRNKNQKITKRALELETGLSSSTLLRYEKLWRN